MTKCVFHVWEWTFRIVLANPDCLDHVTKWLNEILSHIGASRKIDNKPLLHYTLSSIYNLCLLSIFSFFKLYLYQKISFEKLSYPCTFRSFTSVRCSKSISLYIMDKEIIHFVTIKESGNALKKNIFHLHHQSIFHVGTEEKMKIVSCWCTSKVNRLSYMHGTHVEDR